MPRTRVEIQNDVNIYRAAVEDKDLSLNDPMWDDKFDPRYLEVKKARDEAALKLMDFERELAAVKARGEKGRSLEEIRKEISETQSKLNDYRSIENGATNPMQRIMSHAAARLFQCNVNALQLELNEAISEGAERERDEKEKAEIEKIQQRYEKEIRSNPNNAEAYIKRGYDFVAHGLADGDNQVFLDHAIADFTEAIKLDPKAADAYLNRAGLYSRNNDHDRAIADYDQAIRIDTNNAEAYALRGGIYSQKGEHDQALADFEEAIRLNPKCQNAYMFRGIMHFGKGVLNKESADYDKAAADIDKAIADIEEALRIEPKDATAAHLLKKVRNEKQVINHKRREAKEAAKKEAEQYDLLVQKMNNASTEEEYQDLARQLRAMHGYKNTAELANKCDNQYQELRKERERIYAEKINKRKRNIIAGVAAMIIVLVGCIIYNSQKYSVTIPDSVTIIREGEFSRKQLVNVEIPDSVTTIENRAFRRNKLTTIKIPTSVTSIGESAFAGNKITSIVIGANVTLGSDAFGSGFEVFYNKNGLSAGTYRISEPKSMEWRVWYNNFEYQYNKGNIRIIGYNGTDGDLKIPDEISGHPVTIIGKRAFYEKNFNSVIIPNSVTNIEEMAFFGVWDRSRSVGLGTISSVTIGQNVTIIGDRAFENNSLSSISIPNSVTSIGYNAFADNPITSISIGTNVKLGSKDSNGILGENTGFNTAYTSQNSRAGTYTRTNISSTKWARK